MYDLDSLETENKYSCNTENDFKHFLIKEQNILQDGFESWCEKEFAGVSDVGEGESCNVSCSSINSSPASYREDLIADEPCQYHIVANDEKENKRLEVSSLANKSSDASRGCYSCIIDESPFVLTDADYMRAKCRWYFKNISDFEDNQKIIEHMRFLDLFTQCFTLRLMHENTTKHFDGDTCYNFLSSGVNGYDVNVVYLNNDSDFNDTSECLPEKEINHRPEKQEDDDPRMEERYATSASDNREWAFSNKTHFGKPLLEEKMKPNKITKSKSFLSEIGANTLKHNNDVLYNKNINVYSSTVNTEEDILDKIENNKQNLEKHSNILHAVKLETEGHYKNSTPKENVIDCDKSVQSMSMSKVTLKNSMSSTSSLKRSPPVSYNIYDRESTLSLKTTHKPTATDSFTQMQASTCEYFCRPTRLTKQKGRVKKIKHDVESSPLEESEVSDKDVYEISSSLINKFIYNLKKRKGHYSLSSVDESLGMEFKNRKHVNYILDSMFRKDRNQEFKRKIKNPSIIIVGLDCNDETISNKCKISTHVRRYIEGDNLCKPGRYVISSTRSPLEELDEDSNDESGCQDGKPFDPKNKLKHKNDKRLGQTRFFCSSESDTEPEMSSQIESQNVPTSTECSSVSSCDDANKKQSTRKTKIHKCRTCRNNAAAMQSFLHCDKNNTFKKINTQNTYVSCWKRFCVIL